MLRLGLTVVRQQIPLHYGRKRTLQPLPAQLTERAKTPAQGFQIDPILPSLDVSFISEWLSRLVCVLNRLCQFTNGRSEIFSSRSHADSIIPFKIIAKLFQRAGCGAGPAVVVGAGGQRRAVCAVLAGRPRSCTPHATDVDGGRAAYARAASSISNGGKRCGIARASNLCNNYRQSIDLSPRSRYPRQALG